MKRHRISETNCFAPHRILRNHHLLHTLLLLPLLVSTGCTAEEAAICEPGEQRLCPCTAESQGIQVCHTSGTQWETCQCSSDPGDTGELDGPCYSDGTCNEGLECQQGICRDPDYSPAPSTSEQEEWDTVGESGADVIPRDAIIGELCGIENHSNGDGTDGCYWFDGSHGSTIYGLKWQCTEFAFRFICTHYDSILGCADTGKNGRVYGNAKQWFHNEANHPVLAMLDTYESGTTTEPPRPGDVLVFGAGTYGHVAIVKQVTQDAVVVIEQNVTCGPQDDHHTHVLHNDGGNYRVTGALGWMRVPGGWPACGVEAPVLVTPEDDAVVQPGTSITFSWTTSNQSANHYLKVRYLPTDTVVLERDVGLVTTDLASFEEEGQYRWVVYFQDSRCPAGECASSSRTFTVQGSTSQCSGDSDCSTDQYCQAGSCLPDICQQGQNFCQGNQRMLCSANGSSSSLVETCGLGCTNGFCDVPTVSNVSPLNVTLDQVTTFTVTGQNLPGTLAAWIGECEGLTFTSRGSTQATFQCTPSWSTGGKSGVIKDQPGGAVLYNFSVNVSCAGPCVTSVTPTSANLNQLTTFTVTGQNLPGTLAAWIAECEGLTFTSRGSTQATFQCTPSWSTGSKAGEIKDQPGGTVLYNFNLNVN